MTHSLFYSPYPLFTPMKKKYSLLPDRQNSQLTFRPSNDNKIFSGRISRTMRPELW